jgi:hypothetical protein
MPLTCWASAHPIALPDLSIYTQTRLMFILILSLLKQLAVQGMQLAQLALLLHAENADARARNHQVLLGGLEVA